jgi:alcohol dehydrogenase
VDYQGGWAQFVTVPEDAIAHMPAGLDFADAAPFGCAGVTVFNALREAQVRPGGTVAVFGLGGLGHLAVQFSAALGYQTIVIARGDERRVPAKTFGAIDYVDVLKDNAGEALEALGGAELIVYTASDSAPLAGLLRGLRTRGKLMLVGVDGGEVRVPVAGVVLNEQSITGHLTGTPLQTEEAMRFAVAHGIRPALELAPLTEADAVAQRLSSGRVRFRAVLDPWHGER